MKSGFTLKDYWALIKMSMRSAYWRIDISGDLAIKTDECLKS